MKKRVDKLGRLDRTHGAASMGSSHTGDTTESFSYGFASKVDSFEVP